MAINPPEVSYPVTKIKEHQKTGACAWVVFFAPGNKVNGAAKNREEALNAAARALLGKESEEIGPDSAWETIPWLSNVQGE